MRKVLLLVAVVIAVALGFAMSTFKTTVTRTITNLAESGATGQAADVQVGEVSLRLWPPSVDVSDVVVRIDSIGADDPVLEAPLIHVYPQLLPMLVGRARVRAAEAVGPKMLIRRENRDGKPVTLFPLGGPHGTLQPYFPVSVTDARLKFHDLTADPPTSLVVKGLDLELDPADDDGAVALRARAAALGDSSEVNVTGRIRADERADVIAWIDVEFDVRDADPATLAVITNRLAKAPLTPPLSFTGTATGPLGARSTEEAPADPLEGTINGQVGLTVFGRTAPLSFDLDVALDDKFFRVRKGTGEWAHMNVGVTGWSQPSVYGKVGYRFTLEDADIASILGGFGIDERWQPSGEISGELKATGGRTDVRLFYEAKIPELEFDGMPPFTIDADDVSVHGAVLALNADLSASFSTEHFVFAGAEIPQAQFGILYFKNKVAVNQRDLPVWGGTVDASLAYLPADGSAEGGGLANDMDAAIVARNLIPNLGLDVSGRLDSVFQVGYDARGPWTMGRVGVHRGKLGAIGIGHALVRSIAEARGKAEALDDALVSAHRASLSPDTTAFKRLAFDFESREDGFALRGLELRLTAGTIHAEALIDDTRTVAAWGNFDMEPGLTGDLVERIPELGSLVGADGRLRVPIKLQGPSSDLTARVDDRFLEAVDAAAAGKGGGPFVPMDPDGRIVMELPTLDEQFYR